MINPYRNIEVDGREVMVPREVTGGQIVALTGRNPAERTISQELPDGTRMECSPNNRIFPNNGDKFETIIPHRGGVG